MKCKIIIDEFCEERVEIYVREKSAFSEEIKRLVEGQWAEIFGYRENEVIKLTPADIHCITVIDKKVHALCDKERYLLKERLYSLEEKLPDSFVKISQSCLGNVSKMERFDTSISGTLKIRFKNGHTEFVSRRQLKAIKERIGI